ncbi:hypothetical protein LJC33_06820, partial [Eubacteriales bacterium OttesenSCG-928-N13]|nr:hypothetical protein [Eubacteriales bacterium OttesenSCG-928-N13]
MKFRRVAVLVIVTIFLFNTVGFALTPSGKTYNGVDVSHYQGNIDYEKLKQAGYDYVYIKAGEGNTFTDPLFEQNYRRAKAQDMHIGFYYFVTARTVSEGTSQGARFARMIEGLEYDCMPAMDFEQLSGLSHSLINQIGAAFLKALEEDSGQPAVIYSNWSDAENIFGHALSDYPLWIAEYSVSKPRELSAWDEWVGWQHSSSEHVAGISGRVDTDYFTRDILIPDVDPTPSPTASPTVSP